MKLAATLDLLRVGTFVVFTAGLAAQPQISPPVPPVPTPAANPTTEAKRILGKILFWDEQLSSDNTTACGTCHLHEFGGADPRDARHPGPDGTLLTADDVLGTRGVARSNAQNDYSASPEFGFEAQVTERYAPSTFGALWSPTQFWDGRATGQFVDPETGGVAIPGGGSLESQVAGPPVSDVEMAHTNRDWSEITAKLATVEPLRLATDLPADVAAALGGGSVRYGNLFAAAFGDSTISARRIAFAIAAYERTLVADQTPFDAFIAGNPTALTPQQVNGLNAFLPNCASCHTPPLFTDNAFHNIGLRPWQEDPGRMDVTGNFNHRGRFKTPSLRNVGLRPRLMHVGWITDVRDAVDFYLSGTIANQHTQFTDGRDPRVGNIAFPPGAANAITAFLENGLTDPRVANRTFPFDRPTLLSERALDRNSQYGIAHPGSGGIAPVAIAEAPFALENPDFKVGIHDALGGSSALLALAVAPAPPGADVFGQTPLHVDYAYLLTAFAVGLQGTGPGAGHATFRLALPADPASVGLELFGQWLVLDSAASDGLSTARGMRWRVH